MILVQEYVSAMCESIDHMKITAIQKEFAKAVMRASIDCANAKFGMPSTLTSHPPAESTKA